MDEDSDERISLFRKTLKAIAGKNTNFVDVSVAGFSSDEAKANLNLAVQAFIHSHSVRLEPMIKRTWITYRLQTNANQIRSRHC